MFQITWEKDDKQALPDYAAIKSTDTTSEIVIPKSCRDDTGRYVIVCKNVGGTRSASCKVMVKDSPGPPEDLSVSNVTKKSAKLSWKPPRNDGGSKIQTYIVSKRRSDGRGWVKVDSGVSATQSTVRDMLEGYEYYFRVCAVNAIGQGACAETEQPIVARDPVSAPDPPSHLRFNDVTKASVSLSWNAPQFLGNLPLKTYIVEKLPCEFSHFRTPRLSTVINAAL